MFDLGKMKRPLRLLVAAIIVLAVSAGTTLGYFDALIGAGGGAIGIGQWASSSPSGPIEYINEAETDVETGSGGTASVLKYIADLIWDNTVYSGGSLVTGEVRPEFAGFTDDQLIDVIDAAIEYVGNFLAVDSEGNVSFPPSYAAAAVTAGENISLAPGECASIYKVLLFANLSEQIWWTPVTYIVTMGDEGRDISEYSVELLYYPPFGEDRSFGYQYLIRDYASWNINRANAQIEKQNNAVTPAVPGAYDNLIAYRNIGGTYQPQIYKHYQSAAPEWSRFVSGPNLALGAPSGAPDPYNPGGSPIQLQQLDYLSPATRTGMILPGTANGRTVEMKVGVFQRSAPSGAIIRIMPVMINVSRGIIPGETGGAAERIPNITVKAVQGDIWS
jgi:hypothetical protein